MYVMFESSAGLKKIIEGEPEVFDKNLDSYRKEQERLSLRLSKWGRIQFYISVVFGLVGAGILIGYFIGGLFKLLLTSTPPPHSS